MDFRVPRFFEIHAPPKILHFSPPPRRQSGRVTGLAFSPSGHLLYSASCSGSLALYSSPLPEEGEGTGGHASSKLLRLLGNVIAKGDSPPYHSPMALNEDGSWLALIGPHNFTITVLSAESLNEIMRVDITPATLNHTHKSEPFIDSAKLVFFSPTALNQILVVTKACRLLKLSASNGQLLSEAGHMHRKACSVARASKSGRYLLTAGDQVLKLWDYSMAMDINFQVRKS